MLGEVGASVFPKSNPYFNEALTRDQNEALSGIKYTRGEKLLPKELYKALVDLLPNNCVPAERCT